jgi:transcriptional regulator with XRE-family HTH domain
MHLGDKIRLLREERGLTQTELGNMLGYKSKDSISKIENDENNIPLDKLQILANFFEKDLSYFSSATDQNELGTETFYVPKKGLKTKSEFAEENRQLIRENNRLKTMLLNIKVDLIG